MVLFNYSTKELTAKVVYYGPGLCGKTTNLQWIHEKLPIKNKGKMLSLATETDRTLFFDFLPIELGSIRGMKTRIQLYTVPGQVFYNATRRMVLKGADCVVFVCDSQEPMLEANLESWQNLRENLQANEIDPAEIPVILQYNKRDLPNALPLEIMNEKMNPRGLPFFEAMAIKGQGVEETLKGATALVFKALASKYGGAQPATASAATPPRAEAPAAPAPAERTRTDPVPVHTDPVPARSEPPPARQKAAAAVKEATPARRGGAAPARQPEPPSTRPDRAPLEADEEEVVLDMEADLPPPAQYEAELGIEDAPEVELEPLEPSAPAAVAAGLSRRLNPTDTLVKGPEESEDMRRKLRRPPEPELTLESSDEEELEEIPLDESPLPEPISRPAPSPARPAARGSTALAAARTPAAQNPGAAGPVAVTSVPVSVELSQASGTADIAIPVEVFIGNGDAQVHINLRLPLKLKLRK